MCELKAYEQVSVTANMSGNVSGELPERLQQPEDLKMSLIEGGRDNPNDLVYDDESNTYGISKINFVPKAGVGYKLTGLTNLKEADPEIVMPQAVNIDSAQAKLVTESPSIKSIELMFRVPIQSSQTTFFHIDAKIEGAKSIKPIFVDDFGAYKTLKHRSGFLVDYSRINQNTIRVILEVETTKPIKDILIELNNTTPSYYYYNKFKSDNLSNVNTQYVSPTIAGQALNIYNSKTIGCFSGSTVTSFRATVR